MRSQSQRSRRRLLDTVADSVTLTDRDGKDNAVHCPDISEIHDGASPAAAVPAAAPPASRSRKTAARIGGGVPVVARDLTLSFASTDSPAPWVRVSIPTRLQARFPSPSYKPVPRPLTYNPVITSPSRDDGVSPAPSKDHFVICTPRPVTTNIAEQPQASAAATAYDDQDMSSLSLIVAIVTGSLVTIGLVTSAAYKLYRSKQKRSARNSITTAGPTPLASGATIASEALVLPAADPTTTVPVTAAPAHTNGDLVRSMTRQDRCVYLANFLRTRKYAESDETETTVESATDITGSGRFFVSQSSRNNLLDSSSLPIPSCAICLEDFADGEEICLSQNAHCPHQFHLTCAFDWLLSSQECPCCRRDYLSIGQASSGRNLMAGASLN